MSQVPGRRARGLPVAAVSLVFMVLVGLVVALAPVLGMLFATVSLVGGILLSLGGSIPISPYVTTISFLLYTVCRAISWWRTRTETRRARPPSPANTRPVAAPR